MTNRKSTDTNIDDLGLGWRRRSNFVGIFRDFAILEGNNGWTRNVYDKIVTH